MCRFCQNRLPLSCLSRQNMSGTRRYERCRRHPNREWWPHNVHDHSLERRARCARWIAGRTESTRDTLSNILATSLRICPTTRSYTRRGAGCGPGIFCASARTQKSGCGPAREGTFAFLSACVSQTFHSQRAATRQLELSGTRAAAYPAGRTARVGGQPILSCRKLCSADHLYERRWALATLEQVPLDWNLNIEPARQRDVVRPVEGISGRRKRSEHFKLRSPPYCT